MERADVEFLVSLLACAIALAMLLVWVWHKKSPRRQADPQQNLLMHQPPVGQPQQPSLHALAPPPAAFGTVWEWKESRAGSGGSDGPWIPYDSATAEILELQHVQGKRSHVFTHAQGTYSVDLRSMVQTNVDTRHTRDVRRCGVPALVPQQQVPQASAPPQALVQHQQQQASAPPALHYQGRTFQKSQFKEWYDHIPKATVDLEQLFRCIAQLAAGHCRAHGSAANADASGERFAAKLRGEAA
jgi:hypothetical protein